MVETTDYVVSVWHPTKDCYYWCTQGIAYIEGKRKRYSLGDAVRCFRKAYSIGDLSSAYYLRTLSERGVITLSESELSSINQSLQPARVEIIEKEVNIIVEKVIEKEVYPLSFRISELRKSVEQMLNELNEKYMLEGDDIPRRLDSAVKKGLLDYKESKSLESINRIRNADQHRNVTPSSGAEEVCTDVLRVLERMKKRHDLRFKINDYSGE